MALYFFKSANDLNIGILAFVVAAVGYAGSIVFYNAYLPEIASADQQDAVSARGFSMGYLGSSLLLIFNLLMVMNPQWFGISDSGTASRISFLTVGIWWLGFAQITFYYLPDHKKPNINKDKNVIFKGYQELQKVWAKLKESPALKRFLLAFFVYNMAVQTVMYLASLFGEKELHLQSTQLIITVLIIQFVAIGGAYLFSRLSAAIGNVLAIIVAIVIWIGVCVGAYYVYSAIGFYAVATVVGMVMGGIQALSRSTYSKLLPASQDHASYFSFYDVCDKVGTVLGTALYGFIEALTGSMRNSIIALTILFVLGLLLLLRVPRNKLAAQPAFS